MFRATATEPPAPSRGPGRIGHSAVLALDLEAPTEDSAAFLTARNIPVVLDDVGRRSISCADARQLLTERREAEARQRKLAQRQERQAIERDRQRRAQLPGRVPWHDIPAGVTAAQMWGRPRRTRARAAVRRSRTH